MEYLQGDMGEDEGNRCGENPTYGIFGLNDKSDAQCQTLLKSMVRISAYGGTQMYKRFSYIQHRPATGESWRRVHVSHVRSYTWGKHGERL